EADLADERKREPKRLSKHVRFLWLTACTIAVGIAGAADFSNNLLELSEKLNVPIPLELVRQNPHILPDG
ncbi:MAG: pentapeptide repeat-containing protein, partial [Bacteroidota bacterium]